jgi:hypothetical protein
MADNHIDIAADGIAVRVDLAFGMIAELAVTRGGRTVSMLHRAPWIHESTTLPPGAAPHLGRLAGDFFCAPFGDASRDNAPAHGWPANSAWTHIGTSRDGGETVARFRLDRPALGAELIKELRLVDGHPFLYQRHVFTGGHAAGFPVANHAMLALQNGGRLSFSPKRWWETPATGLETDPAKGRSLLAYPARSEDPTQFPLAGGGEADITRYPFAARHEDFLIGVEAAGRTLGWTTVARPAEQDLFVSLRYALRLPMTMLWFSNGGRDYAPWSGRHTGVLGVEEGINRGHLGHSALQTPNALDAAGVPSGFALDPAGSVEVRHIIGSLPWSGEPAIDELSPAEGSILLRAADGTEIAVPCDLDFCS